MFDYLLCIALFAVLDRGPTLSRYLHFQQVSSEKKIIRAYIAITSFFFQHGCPAVILDVRAGRNHVGKSSPGVRNVVTKNN